MRPSRALFGEVARFLVVGGTAFLLDYGVLRLVIWLGANEYIARVVSLAASILLTWQLNRRFTFAAAAPPSWGEFGRYVGTTLVGVVINYTVYVAAVRLGAPLLLAVAVGTLVAAVFNFLRYRKMYASAT